MGDEIDLTEDDVYIERLGGGLYTLELLGLIFASVFATGHAGIRHRLLLQMELQDEDGAAAGAAAGVSGGGAGGRSGDGEGGGMEVRVVPLPLHSTHTPSHTSAHTSAHSMNKQSCVEWYRRAV